MSVTVLVTCMVSCCANQNEPRSHLQANTALHLCADAAAELAPVPLLAGLCVGLLLILILWVKAVAATRLQHGAGPEEG